MSSSEPTTLETPESLPRFMRFGLWVSFAFVVVYQVLASIKFVSPYDGGIVDGPFQLYNWLRRLDAGQIPGRDFNVFHGIGIPYLHWPLYRLLGGDFLASELSRQLICRLATLATYLLVSRFITKHYTLGILWSLTTIIPPLEGISGRIQTLVRFGYWNVFNAHEPGTSMYGLRSLLPVIFVATSFLECSKRLMLIQLVLLSASYLLGVEHGLALYGGVIATLGLLSGLSIKNPSLRPIAKQYGIVLTGSLLLTWILIYLNCGSEGTAKYFTFHFVSQIQDQTWYFGAPPAYFLLDGFRSTLMMTVILGLAVLASTGFIVWQCVKIRQASAAETQTRIPKILGFAYGTISLASLLGIMHYTNATGFNRMLYLFVSLAMYQHVSKLTISQVGWKLLNATLIVVVAVQIIQCAFQATRLSAPHLSEPMQRFIDQAAPILDESENIEQPRLLWSTYSGLYESKLGVFNPSEWDYIIHALGDDRQKYLAKFEEYQPQFVTTIRNDYEHYEEWVRSTMFPLYRTLLFNYKIVAETPYTFLWKHVPPGETVARAETPIELQPVAPLKYEVPAVNKDEDLALIIVDVEYETRNPWRWLPLIGNSPRFLVHFTGSRAAYDVSLPPRLKQHSFSVIPKPGEPFGMEFVVRGIRWDAAIEVKSVKVTKVTLDPANRLFLKPSIAYEHAVQNGLRD